MSGLVRRARLSVPAWAALLGLLLLAGCGGGQATLAPDSSGSEAATPAVPESTGFYDPSQQRTVEPLILPTRTPAGMVRPEDLPGAAGTGATRVAVGGGVATGEAPLPTAAAAPPVVHDPEHTPGPTAYQVSDEVSDRAFALEPVSCFDDFLIRIWRYDGPEEFGPEVLDRLSMEMVAEREDCAASGWSPEFAVGPVYPCGRNQTVGGFLVRDSFSPADHRGRRTVGPTAFSNIVSKGAESVLGFPSIFDYDVLIHLDKLPYSDGSGCWFKEVGRAQISFSVISSGGEVHSNYFLPFPACEAALRGILEDFRAGGRSLDLEAVMEAKDLVFDEFPDLCRSRYWQMTPSSGRTSGCQWEGDTGMLPDGSFLLNWDMFPYYRLYQGDRVRDERLPVTDSRGGSPCWLLSAEGEWLYSDPVEPSPIQYALGLVEPGG